ncbi:MAG: nuclear transport factor 2 family protein [Anaerolineae bacterium]|nr:nuclear transport factor 2 family protein [Anaerolineae bacterium]
MTERDTQLIQLARMVYTGEAAEHKIISPDILWHVPGHNPVSGEYRGADYFQVMSARMAPLDRWEFRVECVMVNGDYVVTQIRLRGERKGRQIDTRGGHILRFGADNQIVEGWGFTEDQDALDDFFAA